MFGAVHTHARAHKLTIWKWFLVKMVASFKCIDGIIFIVLEYFIDLIKSSGRWKFPKSGSSIGGVAWCSGQDYTIHIAVWSSTFCVVENISIECCAAYNEILNAHVTCTKVYPRAIEIVFTRTRTPNFSFKTMRCAQFFCYRSMERCFSFSVYFTRVLCCRLVVWANYGLKMGNCRANDVCTDKI